MKQIKIAQLDFPTKWEKKKGQEGPKRLRIAYAHKLIRFFLYKEAAPALKDCHSGLALVIHIKKPHSYYSDADLRLSFCRKPGIFI